MNITPLRCKLCQAVIKPPDIIIGNPPELHQLHMLQKMGRHLHQHAEKEANNGAASKPHADALARVLMTIEGIKNWALAEYFELPEDLAAGREYGRASIHQATRKFKLSDKDLDAFIQESSVYRNRNEPWPTNEIVMLMRNLRDRYEEIGEYAPVQPDGVIQKP